MNYWDPDGLCKAPAGIACFETTVTAPYPSDVGSLGAGGFVFGGGGLNKPLAPPPIYEGTFDSVNPWNLLSADCQKGLAEAMPKTGTSALLAGLDRAVAAMDTLTAAASAHGIDASLLAAIGIEESDFRNIPQANGGKGMGVFQIDLGKNPSVTAAQASDLTFAANWAAAYLQNSMLRLGRSFPNLTGSALIDAVADSYNEGVGRVRSLLSSGQNPDSRTTNGHYGSTVLNLIKCF